MGGYHFRLAGGFRVMAEPKRERGFAFDGTPIERVTFDLKNTTDEEFAAQLAAMFGDAKGADEPE
jgi:hypothetical protein